MVCPECGHTEFYTEHHAVIRRAWTFSEGGREEQGDDTTLDVDRDVDVFTCDDCGHQVQGSDDLVTEEQYNGTEEVYA